MKIVQAAPLAATDFLSVPTGPYLRVVEQQTYDGRLVHGISWKYGGEGFERLRSAAIKAKARWMGNFWEFPDRASADNFLVQATQRHPAWPVISTEHVTRAVSGMTYAVSLNRGTEVGVIVASYPLPAAPDWRGLDLAGLLKQFDLLSLVHTKAGGKWILAVGSVSAAHNVASTLEKCGAQGSQEAMRVATSLRTDRKVAINSDGWAVELSFDLHDPQHHRVINRLRAKGRSLPSDGHIQTTRKRWKNEWKPLLTEHGIHWSGDDPDADIAVPNLFNPKEVPGWDAPTEDGLVLHAYQKEGIQFVASRRWRALIADEMGLGKTVQAIGAAEAAQCSRIVIVCPVSAKYVWEAEINKWASWGLIQQIRHQKDDLLPDARWHIVSFDQLISRAQAWSVKSKAEEKAIVDAVPELKGLMEPGNEYPKKLPIKNFVTATPQFDDDERRKAWQAMARRLRADLLTAIIESGDAMLIVDEAHRAKNRSSKRSRAIQMLAENKGKVLLLTGTPIRNTEDEAVSLLRLLDPIAAPKLFSNDRYGVQDLKDYLMHLMIRRTKSEVLTAMPPKVRQRIDVDIDHSMDDYFDAVQQAVGEYRRVISEGGTHARARGAMEGGLAGARRALGLAKASSGHLAEIILNVVETKGCCVVFCHHHVTSDKLGEQLRKSGLRLDIVDGRRNPKSRANIVNDFQVGKLDVLIAGTQAAGEAIDLTRADVAVFAELDWVPAALLQAEDRIHRIGQTRGTHIIHVIARVPGLNIDQLMINVLGKKIALAGSLLDEDMDAVVSTNASVKNEVINNLLAEERD